MEILNKQELDEWLFERANNLGHKCDSVKGVVHGEEINTAWVDGVTGETIEIIYSYDMANDKEPPKPEGLE